MPILVAPILKFLAIGALKLVGYGAVVAAGIWAASGGGQEVTIAGESVTLPPVAVLDQILQELIIFFNGDTKTDTAGLISNVSYYSRGLFWNLLIIDFLVSIIMGLIAFENGPNFLTLYITKIFKYGTWLTIIAWWPYIVDWISQSLALVGSSGMGSDYGLNNGGIMYHPSKVIQLGYLYASPYWQFIFSSEALNKVLSDFTVIVPFIVGLIATVILFIGFFLLGVNMFFTAAEFTILSSLILIFVPFAVFEKTERFAANAFNLVFSCGTRCMVMCSLISFIYPFVTSKETIFKIASFKDKPSVFAAMFAMGVALLFAHLAIQAPQMAGDAISGSLSLEAESGWRHAMGTAHTVKAVSSATQSVANIPANAGVKAAAAASTAYSIGSSAYGKMKDYLGSASSNQNINSGNNGPNNNNFSGGSSGSSSFMPLGGNINSAMGEPSVNTGGNGKNDTSSSLKTDLGASSVANNNGGGQQFRGMDGLNNINQTGQTGQSGKDGAKGDKGDKGFDGMQGMQSMQGAQGQRGSDAGKQSSQEGSRGPVGDFGHK